MTDRTVNTDDRTVALGTCRVPSSHASGGHRYALTLAVLAIATTTYGLLQSLTLPALPALQRELHASSASAGWILTAFLLSATVATPVEGRLGDMYGKKRVLIAVLLVLSAGCLISAVAPGMVVMLLGRVLQGSVGGLFPLAFGIIRDEFPPAKVRGGIGLIAAIVGFGGGIGIVLSGPILTHLSYHWLFWIPFLIAVASTVAGWLWVRESPVRTLGRVNWPAVVLLAVWLVALLVAISQGPVWGWSSRRVLGFLAVAAVTSLAWVRVEMASATPLIDVRTLTLRPVWITNVTSLLLGFGMLSAYVVIPQFVQTATSSGYGFGKTVTGAGLVLVPANFVMVLVGSTTGHIARAIGSKLMLAVGALLAAVAFGVLVAAHGRPLDFYLAALVLGGGIGMASAAMPNVIVEAVPPTQTGAATGVNINVRTLGSALGASVVITVVNGGLVGGQTPPEHRFVLAFALCVVVLLIGLVAALCVPVRRYVETQVDVGRAGVAAAAADV